jgi:hypothetical protein
MQSRPELKQRVMNAIALVIATALSGVTLWGVVQMAPTDTEILGAANVPWVYPKHASAPNGGAQLRAPDAPQRMIALRP